MIFKLYFYSCSAERCKQALTSEHSSENKQRITFMLQTAAAGHKSINKYESKLCFEHFPYLTCSCVQSKYVQCHFLTQKNKIHQHQTSCVFLLTLFFFYSIVLFSASFCCTDASSLVPLFSHILCHLFTPCCFTIITDEVTNNCSECLEPLDGRMDRKQIEKPLLCTHESRLTSNCYLERRVTLTRYLQEKHGIRNCVVFVILAVDCFLSYTDITPPLL